MKKPNILLITMDQLSIHALSSYGESICRTPAIDALRKDCIKFTKAYTPCALCTPARASILTGLYPHSHGAMHNSGILSPFTEKEIGDRLSVFSGPLKEQGYDLGYQGKWHAGIAETAQDLGFKGFGPGDYGHYKESPRYRSYLEEKGLKEVEEIIEFRAQAQDNWMDSVGYVRGDLEATGPAFLRHETCRMIDEYEKPFFQWLSFWGPHAPYWPHENYIDYYKPADIPRWKSFDESDLNKPYAHKRFRESVMPKAAEADWETWSWIISRYYAQTTMIDEQIGLLLDHLKDKDLYDDMMIIFTADHGDSLGIHGGTFDKGAMAFEQIYNIPLLIKMPGNIGRGDSLNQFVSLLDLGQTICEVAGCPLESNHGVSLLSLIHKDDINWRDFMFAEFHGHRFPVAQRILWFKDYKYILNFADRDELYHISEDPEELENLIDSVDFSSILEKIKIKMNETLTEYDDNMHPQARSLLIGNS